MSNKSLSAGHAVAVGSPTGETNPQRGTWRKVKKYGVLCGAGLSFILIVLLFMDMAPSFKGMPGVHAAGLYFWLVLSSCLLVSKMNETDKW
ncbi:hypothetical protein ACR3H8_20355 [Pseudomonas aeruginosa]|uniref:hypothetical protein n=1 Tax=Pseudomonas aeruginosa TaxID=287 RepID=UPI00044FBEE5|nr:hypothetical protein [Pseudomonas aeruginosa]ETV28779.1 hypothetical protein Q046_05696 [Pseudomonas aeruginosa BWHPSA041]MCC0301093.1 hypothetical protein [Pseudomonas aeruginosa]MCC0408492.1 hypothetical protein [Pseudomonas aeruginosa]MCC0433634.1 hypothetical protein [Pseudomonas aeruginosa]MCT5450474.1 hypothetical protein [Pseudomonas aeruginosa]